MELKPGYKQTEVGVIPEDWEVATAEMICELIVDCKNRTPSVINDDEFAVVRTPNVRNGKFIREDLRFTDEHCFMEWTARAVPKDGDILITREAPLGEVCLVPTDVKVCLGQRMMLYRPDPIKVVSGFFLYCLMSSGVRSTLLKKIGGSTVGHAKVDDIRNLQVPLPTKAEQEAIAEVLNDADALIESLEQLITKKRQIKQGAMQELLTGKKRLPGFSGEWEVKRVAEFGEIITGGTPNTQVNVFWGEGYPWITPTDISRYCDMYTSERTITQKGLNAIRVLPSNTVLVTCIASIGKNAILKVVGGCNQQINAIVPNTSFSADFLYYLFEVNKQYLIANSGTTATSIISKKTFEELIFKVPFIYEQNDIALFLSDMDNEITVLEEKLEKAHHLKQGMMQNLLSGKIRLV